MKTPEQIAQHLSWQNWFLRKTRRALFTEKELADWMTIAIKQDRAQRTSDPAIELREWATKVSTFMAEDKSNDWSEEIAELEAIEEELDA